jgi:hypothetical protein
MTNADRLLGEFIDAWNAGARPDPDAFTRRAEGVDRAGLEAGIEAFLAVAPLPRYDAATLAALRAEPAVRAMARAAAADATAMPTLLARLRARARASLDDVARALGRAFGWDAAGERRARGYLEALEAGRLDPSGVSRRLTVALADALTRGRRPSCGAPRSPARRPSVRISTSWPTRCARTTRWRGSSRAAPTPR